MEPTSLKAGFDRVAGGVILAVVISLIYLVLSGLFVRHGGGFAKVVRFSDFEYLYLLSLVPVAAFIVGLILGLERSTYLLGTIFGTNNSTSKVVTLGFWLFFFASYFLFFYQK
jgi:hypothetical protein